MAPLVSLARVSACLTLVLWMAGCDGTVRREVVDGGTCTPSCGKAACGPDGCGGTCGACDAGNSCQGGVCLLGTCLPACGNSLCGPDGCGGTCGTCGANQTCQGGACVTGSCTPACPGTPPCGANGCGGSCGTCANGQVCQAGACVTACIPSCTNSVCGPDGCGGSCGTCPNHQTCNQGACITGSCTPSCLARDCGSDGCGGTCGDCAQEFPNTTCDTSLGLCVINTAPADLSATWGAACWWVCPTPSPYNWCRAGQRFQAIPFQLTTSVPVPLEATLYDGKQCDPGAGLNDNLNDTGGTVGGGGWLYFFIHHPDESPTSAVWWLGHQSSGCVDYTNAPNCP